MRIVKSIAHSRDYANESRVSGIVNDDLDIIDRPCAILLCLFTFAVAPWPHFPCRASDRSYCIARHDI